MTLPVSNASVVSDGTLEGLKVFVDDTEIRGIISLAFRPYTADSMPELTMVIGMPHLGKDKQG